MMRTLATLQRDERGAAIIELALFAPIVALMIAGTVDISNAYSRKLALEQGAQRAIEKIMQTTEASTVEDTLANETVCQVNGTDSSGVCKSSPITTSNVTITYTLVCSLPSGDTTQSSSDPTTFNAYTCPSGATPSRYIQIAVTDKYTPMFAQHFANFTNSDGTYHISAVAGMRIQ